MSSDSFWTKTKEDEFESLELFQELEKIFATGRARNLEIDSGPKLKLPKIKELKVLDAKSAQNICEFSLIFVLGSSFYCNNMYHVHCTLV